MKRRRSEKMIVGLAQINCEPGNVKANIDHVKEIIFAHREQVDLLVFPEYALSGYVKGHANYDVALKHNDEDFHSLVNATRDVAVVVGFIEETSTFNFYNSIALINNRQLIRTHKKIYLVNYGIFEERKHFSTGKNQTVWNLDKFRLSPFVCADAWNPAMVHLAAAESAHVMLFPACSPEEGLGGRLSTKEHWQRMNRFYATTYGSYILFVNRVGNDEQLTFWGGSEIVDPFGQVVAATDSKEEEVVIGEIDLAKVRESRTILHTIRDEDLLFIRRRLDQVLAYLTSEVE